jgi:hypothetical protein
MGFIEPIFEGFNPRIELLLGELITKQVEANIPKIISFHFVVRALR